MRKMAQQDIGNSAYVRCYRSGGFMSYKDCDNQVLMSIGKTAYVVMVEMALGFQKVRSYTGVMENDQ